jgi:hypothetical protein
VPLSSRVKQLGVLDLEQSCVSRTTDQITRRHKPEALNLQPERKMKSTNYVAYHDAVSSSPCYFGVWGSVVSKTLCY